MKKLTANDLIAELDEARQIAKDNANPTAMISATVSKAKICGLDNGKNLRAVEPQPIKVIVSTQDARKTP